MGFCFLAFLVDDDWWFSGSVGVLERPLSNTTQHNTKNIKIIPLSEHRHEVICQARILNNVRVLHLYSTNASHNTLHYIIYVSMRLDNHHNLLINTHNREEI